MPHYCGVDFGTSNSVIALMSGNEDAPVTFREPTLMYFPDDRDTTASVFRPGTTLAVTIPTVDPQRGRVLGVVVQLMTLVRDQNGEVFDLPHAEWSVRLDWG